MLSPAGNGRRDLEAVASRPGVIEPDSWLREGNYRKELPHSQAFDSDASGLSASGGGLVKVSSGRTEAVKDGLAVTTGVRVDVVVTGLEA